MLRISDFKTGIQNKQIQKAQANEIARFIFDNKFALRMSKERYYSSLGDWLPVGKNDSILELGCGPGRFVSMLSGLGFNVTGVDPMEFPTWETIRNNTTAVLKDQVYSENLPFPDDSFDHLVCLGTLLYVSDPEKALKEMVRVVRKGGHIAIRTVNKLNTYTLRTGKKYDPASNHLFTMEELLSMVIKAGMAVSNQFSYGYRSSYDPYFWWYLDQVWLPIRFQDFLSDNLRPENRVNNTVFAYVPNE